MHNKPVLIVGAGPGDKELLTLKAVNALQNADAVVYDRLISDEILQMANNKAQMVFAGKSCKTHFMTQDEINEKLVELVNLGLKVVRLKGGDPFIFGRGGEEAEYLLKHNVPFEIIPGISSASGCSANVKIPLTYRGLATGVRYITGHCKEPELSLNWSSLADIETTLVVYMGLANLKIICKKLIQHGLPPNLELAAIENGTTNYERIVITNLEMADIDINKANLQPPTLLIIGRVVSLYKG
jgi:uroporphyrin-III C-methyltransferase